MSEPKRDRYGRYVIPDPNTGKEVPWTRATTFADTLEDSYNLTLWKMRATAVGVSRRQDMVALAQSLDIKEDKKQLDDLCKAALTVAQGDVRSNLGTALHRFTERWDRAEAPQVPAAYQGDIDAYVALKRKHGIMTNPKFIERITVLPEWQVAGTMDRIVKMDGKFYIADLKTGDDLSHGFGKIAIQLALYAHGYKLWNEQAGEFEPMPPVDQELGLVFHIPAGSGHAEKIDVDLTAGWKGANLAYEVRKWRAISRTLGSKINSQPPV